MISPVTADYSFDKADARRQVEPCGLIYLSVRVQVNVNEEGQKFFQYYRLIVSMHEHVLLQHTTFPKEVS